MKIKKILITGAAGYLAGFIIERLRSKYELALTDRVEPKPGFQRSSLRASGSNEL